MPYLSIAATNLYYEQHGSGPDLVLLHGVGGNHASWFEQLAGLSDHFRITTFDARGFGNSNDLEQLGRSGFVGDLEMLWNHLEIESAVLLGQSMGGGCALSFACRHPDRVRSLIMADTLVGIDLPHAAQKLMSEAELSTVNLAQVERVLGRTTRQKQPEKVILYTQIASFNTVNLRTLKGVQSKASLADIDAIGIPVLFVVGSEDVLFPPDAIRLVQQQLTHSHFIEITGAGHSAHFEAPDKFNRIILEWVRSIEAAS